MYDDGLGCEGGEFDYGFLFYFIGVSLILLISSITISISKSNYEVCF